MDFLVNIVQKLFMFEKEPQKIGLSQLKETEVIKQPAASIKSKDVKLSDLMRRAS